jgi:hypothetical protein
MWGQPTPFLEIAVPKNPGLTIAVGDPICVEPGESEEQK